MPNQPLLDTAQFGSIIPGSRAHWGFVMGLLFIFLFWVFLWRSKKGYEVRVSGLNSQAALYSGINTNQNILLVTFLAGGLAGLAGASEIMGVQGRLFPLFSPGYGFDGIAVALVGGCNAIGIFFAGLLFGLLESGAAADAVDADPEGYRDDHFLHHHHAGGNAERHYLHYEPIVKKERDSGERK